jgi:hypothetical protein
MLKAYGEGEWSSSLADRFTIGHKEFPVWLNKSCGAQDPFWIQSRRGKYVLSEVLPRFLDRPVRYQGVVLIVLPQ